MQKHQATLGIYGIQDIQDDGYAGYSHDHGLVLMHKGKIIKYLELERLTRVRYDNSLHKCIYQLLKEEGVFKEFQSLDIVSADNVLGSSFISIDGKIRLEKTEQVDIYSLAHGKGWWLGKEIRPYFVSHELAHLYSCLPFYGDFKENSLLIHLDGGASVSNFSAGHYKESRLKVIEKSWDLKNLTSLFNSNALVFAIVNAGLKDQNSVAGKIMGLASYVKYNKELEDWLHRHDYFKDAWSSKEVYIRQVEKDWPGVEPVISTENAFIQDVAATIQHVFTRDVLQKIKSIQETVKAEYLYFTGGCGLNINLNTLLEQSGMFREVLVPPCTNDSGLALGAACYLEKRKHGSVHVAPPYLNNWGISGTETVYHADDIALVANKLLAGEVVAACNGHGETGPRALGNRSILALANDYRLAREVISVKMKQREWYRPVAPVMLSKNMSYFTTSPETCLNKYMLKNCTIRKEKLGELQGATHVDHTARIQTISNRADNPFMYDLLTYLDENHDVKALVNTSFNKKGESMVHFPGDAKSTARAMGIGTLVINGKIVIFD